MQEICRNAMEMAALEEFTAKTKEVAEDLIFDEVRLSILGVVPSSSLDFKV